MSTAFCRAHPFVLACGFLLAAWTTQAQTTDSAADRSPESSSRRLSVRVRDIGALIAGGESQGTAINNQGHVVGYGNTEQIEAVPFLWTRAHGLVRILGNRWGIAVDVNDRDQVVGVFGEPGGAIRGFLWSRRGGLVDLGAEFHPSAVNDRGQIAGACIDSFNGVILACLWDDGVQFPLGTLGGTQSFAADINDRGHVVGISETADLTRHAFVWKPETSMVDLTPNIEFSSAAGTNNRGEIVGSVCCPSLEVVWSRRGTRARALAPGDEAQAVSINAHGWATGTRFPFATVWLPEGRSVTLPTRGGEFSNSAAINNHGQIVGSVATEGGHAGRAVMWTVSRGRGRDRD